MPSVNQPPAPPVQVDPSRVRRCGQQLRQIADGLAADVTAHSPGLAATRSQPAGWEVATAAGRAAHEWSELLLSLAHGVDALGSAFVAAADSYAGTDGRAAARSGAATFR